MLIAVNLEQFLKAPFWISVTVEGILIEASAPLSLNALLPMNVNPSGSVAETKDSQYAKVDCSILLTPTGI